MKHPYLFLLLYIILGISIHAESATYTVTTVADTGAGSLRDAITQANSNPGQDTIVFNIPGSGPHTIDLSTAFFLNNIMIDGTTQPGYSYMNPQVILYGDSTTNISGINVGVNTHIKGMMIRSFYQGLSMQGNNTIADSNIIHDCGKGIELYNGSLHANIIGAHPHLPGTLPNGIGIEVFGDSVQIGGDQPGEGNMILGNSSYGIRIDTRHAIAIQGNAIGTDFTGKVVAGNGWHGIYIVGDENNSGIGGLCVSPSFNILIGGNTQGAGNLIKYNDGDGISLLSYYDPCLGVVAAGNTVYHISIYGNVIVTKGNSPQYKPINDYPGSSPIYPRSRANEEIGKPIISLSTIIDSAHVLIEGNVTVSSTHSLNKQQIHVYESDTLFTTAGKFLGQTLTDSVGHWELLVNSVSGVLAVAATRSDSLPGTNSFYPSTSIFSNKYNVGLPPVCKAAANVNLGPDTVACAAAPVVLNAGTGFCKYAWSNNGSTTPLLTVSQAGQYSVTVSDDNGCTAADSVLVNTSANIDLGNDTSICFGSSVVLDAGTGYTTYAWSNGASTSNLLTVNQEDNYVVTVTDANGCTATDDIYITIPDSLQISGTVQDVICYGDNTGTIDISVSGGTSPYSYVWSNGDTIQDINNVAAGTYTLTVTDAIGCTATNNSVLNQPNELVVFIGNQRHICPGDTLTITPITTGGNGQYTYNWSTGATNVSSIEVHAPGIYSVSAIDANGCLAQDSVGVDTTSTACIPSVVGNVYQSNNSPMPNTKVLLILFNSSDSSVAAIDSTTTDGNGWYKFNTNEPTVYTKAIPDAGTYPDEMPTYHLSSLVFQTADVIATVPNLAVIADINCIAGVNPGGPGFVGGFISQGAGKQQGPGDPVEGLTVILIDSNNDPVALRTTDQEGYFAVSNLALGTYTVWADQYGIDNNLAPSIELTTSESVKDSLQFILQPTYLQLDSATAVPPSMLNEKAKVYPNPVNSTLYIKLPHFEVQVQIFDLNGKPLDNQFALNTASFDISHYPAGIYLLRLQAENEVVYRKFVKQ